MIKVKQGYCFHEFIIFFPAFNFYLHDSSQVKPAVYIFCCLFNIKTNILRDTITNISTFKFDSLITKSI